MFATRRALCHAVSGNEAKSRIGHRHDLYASHLLSGRTVSGQFGGYLRVCVSVFKLVAEKPSVANMGLHAIYSAAHVRWFDNEIV